MKLEIDQRDQFLIGEQQTRLNQYRGPLDVVVDVGAHVGTFSLEAASRGADLVIAIEPDPVNFSMLVKNIIANDLWGTVVPIPLAAAPSNMAKAMLRRASERPGANGGQNSLAFLDKFPGLPVRTVDLFLLILDLERQVDYLKMDIEGGEWALLSDPAADDVMLHVNYVDIETHPLGNKNYFDGTDAEAEMLEERLTAWGFHVTAHGHPAVWRGGRGTSEKTSAHECWKFADDKCVECGKAYQGQSSSAMTP